MQLLKGAIVSSASVVMSFVCDNGVNGQLIILASFSEGAYRNIHVGDYAEVVLKMYPGRVFAAQVEYTIDVTNEG